LPAPDQPNIILITTDQQRYDTLGCNGNSMVRTPALDALARDGSRFERVYVNNPVCVPSRACIQTGRYAHQHGVRYMESEIEKTSGLPFWEQTFMERLQVAGYETGASGKIHMKPTKGFDWSCLTNGKGARWTAPYGSSLGPAQLGNEYASWLEQRHPGGYAELYEQRRQSEYQDHFTAIANILPIEEYIDYWVTENALDFVSRDRDNPFFCWFGLCSPHPPLDPPAAYAELYPIDDIPLSARFTQCPDKPVEMTEQKARRFIAYYWSLCTFIDDMVSKLVERLKGQGGYDNTLIIFTSDHGEMMCDFGKRGKGNFDEAVIRVPCIVKPPRGQAPASSIDGLVELIDLAPTILDYAGLPIPELMQGTSVRPLIEGGGTGKDQVLCEFTTADRSQSSKCVRTDRYKYAYWSGGRGAELFDLQEDPEEWRDVADDPAYRDVRVEMHERLMDQMLRSP